VNNSTLRHCRHDRSPSCFARFLVTLGLAATVCGCHYCPHNRHVLRPGQSCVSDHVRIPCACHPGGRRGVNGCIDGSCDQSNQGCTDEQLEAYYPTPQLDEAPPAPADVTEETPSDVAVDEPRVEASPLRPFTPVENFPPPPAVSVGPETVTAEPSTVGTRLSPVAPAPEPVDTVVPLFEGRIELNTIEAEPLEEAIVPQALPNPRELPPSSLPTTTNTPAAKEVDEENPAASLFRLRLPPRLFRLHDDDEDVELTDPAEPVPPISETSATQGSRVLYGHSLTSPSQIPATSGSDTSWYGHSQR
jgi:hypothetical protein